MRALVLAASIMLASMVGSHADEVAPACKKPLARIAADCRPGDIIIVPLVAIMTNCDFSKTITVVQGEAAYCVYQPRKVR